MEGIINKETLLNLFDKIKAKVKSLDKKQIAIIVIACLIIMALISSVSSTKVSDETIKEEIIHYEGFYEKENPLLITEYTEYRRDTDKENKYDNIWVAIVAENDYIRYEASYFLSFTLYNDGWELRTIEYTNDYLAYESQSYSAKKSLNEEQINLDATEKFNDIINEYNLTDIEIYAEIDEQQNGVVALEVPCYVQAKNDVAFFYANIVMSYDCNWDYGWTCYNADIIDYTYEARSEPEREIVNLFFDSLAGEYTIDDYEKIDSNHFIYYYTQYDAKTYDNLTVTRKGAWTFEFNPAFVLDSQDSCWSVGERTSEIVSIDLNLKGKWSYSKGNEYFNLTVSDATETKISYNFDLSFYETHVWGNEQNCQLSTEGKTEHDEWIYEYDSENSCIIFKTPKSIFSIAWCGGLSDKDYYLEYRAYAVETEENISGFYVDDRLITKA